MTQRSGPRMAILLMFVGALSAGGPAAGASVAVGAVTAVQVLREGGCGGLVPAAPALHTESALNDAAQRWAAGAAPAAAVAAGGYRADALQTLHLRGPDSATLRALRNSYCHTLSNPVLSDIGSYRRGADTWLVMASPYRVPAPNQASASAVRAVQLVNEARAHGARCGKRSFAPAPPVKLSDALAGVALGHAADMASHGYFEHEDLVGRSPADRVRAVGYREKLVGENIAYGPQSTEEVVQGWLDSPDHCENIMDPRFAEMGIAYAAGRTAKRGLYWVQLLVAPRA